MAEGLIRDGRLLKLDGHVTVMHDDRFRHYGAAVSPGALTPGRATVRNGSCEEPADGRHTKPDYQSRSPAQITMPFVCAPLVMSGKG